MTNEMTYHSLVLSGSGKEGRRVDNTSAGIIWQVDKSLCDIGEAEAADDDGAATECTLSSCPSDAIKSENWQKGKLVEGISRRYDEITAVG